MRSVGIVCEYNPFHNGHLYQIEETRRLLGDDTAVVGVMSGDFVQRGEAAVFEKFTRAEAACRSGADLIVELPLPWCLSSAEGFARGAVSLLDALGCEHLSFGSESGDLDALSRLADFMLESDALSRIHALMEADRSLSFARARQLAAGERLGEAALLSNPNDILAVEYLKALRTYPHMKAMAVRRIGSGHDSHDSGEQLSAMRLRAMIENREEFSAYVPPAAAEVFRQALRQGRVRSRALLEIALLSRLYLLEPEDFDRLPDAGGGAGRRLYGALRENGNLEQAVSAAASRLHTAARMRRMLLCAALGVCAEDTKGGPPYIRLLASNERGRAFLRSRRGALGLPVLSRAADRRKMDSAAERVFALGTRAHDVYCLQFVANDYRTRGEDWKRSGIVVHS